MDGFACVIWLDTHDYLYTCTTTPFFMPDYPYTRTTTPIHARLLISSCTTTTIHARLPISLCTTSPIHVRQPLHHGGRRLSHIIIESTVGRIFFFTVELFYLSVFCVLIWKPLFASTDIHTTFHETCRYSRRNNPGYMCQLGTYIVQCRPMRV